MTFTGKIKILEKNTLPANKKGMRHFIRIFFIALVFFILSEDVSAQKRKKKLTREDSTIIKTTAPSSPKEIIIKYGTASFYAQKFNGRKTANGNTYSSVKYTAACNVLPLGTWVKVTNIKNDKSVVVYINDRLHPKNNRLMDLSKTSAGKLGYVSHGLTKVKVEVLGKLNYLKL